MRDVLAALIVFLGASVMSVMPEDIFPEINIPVVSVIWQYTGYAVRTNATPTTIEDLNNIPIKYTNGPTVFLKDVGQVHDGWAVQQNVVRENGRRSVCKIVNSINQDRRRFFGTAALIAAAQLGMIGAAAARRGKQKSLLSTQEQNWL